MSRDAFDLLVKARQLLAAGEVERAATQFAELTERFADDDTSRVDLSTAWVYRGLLLGEAGEGERALECYEKARAITQGSSDPELRAKDVWGRYNAAVALDALGRVEAAMDTYNDLLNDYLDAPPPGCTRMIANSMLGLGNILVQFKRPDMAVKYCDEIIRRYGHMTDLDLREIVANAATSKGSTLRDFGELEGALLAFDDVRHRVQGAEERSLRVCLMRATIGRATVLQGLGRLAEAAYAYALVLGQSEDLDDEGDPETEGFAEYARTALEQLP